MGRHPKTFTEADVPGLTWVLYLGALPWAHRLSAFGVLRADRTKWSVHVLLLIESVGIRAAGRIDGLG
jgi:hypothetical protein